MYCFNFVRYPYKIRFVKHRKFTKNLWPHCVFDMTHTFLRNFPWAYFLHSFNQFSKVCQDNKYSTQVHRPILFNRGKQVPRMIITLTHIHLYFSWKSSRSIESSYPDWSGRRGADVWTLLIRYRLGMEFHLKYEIGI